MMYHLSLLDTLTYHHLLPTDAITLLVVLVQVQLATIVQVHFKIVDSITKVIVLKSHNTAAPFNAYRMKKGLNCMASVRSRS